MDGAFVRGLSVRHGRRVVMGSNSRSKDCLLGGSFGVKQSRRYVAAGVSRLSWACGFLVSQFNVVLL
jgi:hypothetical protein